MSERFDVCHEFEVLLCDQAKKRPERQSVIDGEPEWVVCERQALFSGINKRRAERGLPSIDLTTFMQKVERPSIGHSDYGQKLCIRSMLLSIGVD